MIQNHIPLIELRCFLHTYFAIIDHFSDFHVVPQFFHTFHWSRIWPISTLPSNIQTLALMNTPLLIYLEPFIQIFLFYTHLSLWFIIIPPFAHTVPPRCFKSLTSSKSSPFSLTNGSKWLRFISSLLHTSIFSSLPSFIFPNSYNVSFSPEPAQRMRPSTDRIRLTSHLPFLHLFPDQYLSTQLSHPHTNS